MSLLILIAMAALSERDRLRTSNFMQEKAICRYWKIFSGWNMDVFNKKPK
jgi:hypothetical protein